VRSSAYSLAVNRNKKSGAEGGRLPVNREHWEQLKASGIDPEQIKDMSEEGGLESVHDGLAFRYYELDGTVNGFTRTRLDSPKSSCKYVQEKGTGCRLYTPPQEGLQSNLVPLAIVEGEKKTLSALCRLRGKVATIGIGGVWNWVEKDKKALIPPFKQLNLEKREVKVIFDSDTQDKKQCGEAESALTAALRAEGANVKIVLLPKEEKGLDDWFVRWGDAWREPFGQLWSEAVPRRLTDNMSAIYNQVYTYNEMLNNTFPIPRFFVGRPDFGIIAEGMVCFVHGSSNLGKTYLATQMAVSISMGLDFMGMPCGPKGTSVLYLQGELPPGLYASGRLQPIRRYVTQKELDPPDSVKFLNWSFDFAQSSRYKEVFTEGSWEGLAELDMLLDKFRPKVLVIDALQNYNNLVESSNDQNRELLKRLKHRALNRNMGIILVDHDKKDSVGVEALRGASNKVDLADTVLGLFENKDGLFLSYDKVRYIQEKKPDPVKITRIRYYDAALNASVSSPFFEEA
jgi:hypothetical protein